MIHYLLLFSRQGKVRLQKYYFPLSEKYKKRASRELTTLVLARKPKMCNFIEWEGLRIVYKRYASLFFLVAVDITDNELIALEVIHRYVEVLDKYFGNACELDIIFNFEKAQYILDEVILGGELQEPSKKNVMKAVYAADSLQQTETPQGLFDVMGETEVI